MVTQKSCKCNLQHHQRLDGRSFWDVPCTADLSCGWPKLLKIRSTVRPFNWHTIYNVKSTSMWLDTWNNMFRLKRVLATRIITRSRFSLNNPVYDLIDNGTWRWLPDCHGQLRPFSISLAWDSIRLRDNEVTWFNIMWFPHCIPRHVFHMWLAINQKLKTQDLLRKWDVWFKVRVLSDMNDISPRMGDVVSYLIRLSKGRSVTSVISRFILVATTYYIWQERNSILFKKK
ncbi:reverse transcriptase domain, reverse transcriptase zinc-binding domain protein [Tanacetum coccineum]